MTGKLRSSASRDALLCSPQFVTRRLIVAGQQGFVTGLTVHDTSLSRVPENPRLMTAKGWIQ